MMKLITVDYLLGRGPCEEYTEERLKSLVGDGIRPVELLDMRRFLGVPAEDRLWVLLHRDFLSLRDTRLFACWCARRALRSVPNPDPRSTRAVKLAEKYAEGAISREELNAAGNAAWAASNTVDAGVGGTAGNAAWFSAWLAKGAATLSPAWASSWAVDGAECTATEYYRQLKHLRRYFG